MLIFDNHEIKTAIIWDVAPCSCVDTTQAFGRPYCRHTMMDALWTYEIFVTSNSQYPPSGPKWINTECYFTHHSVRCVWNLHKLNYSLLDLNESRSETLAYTGALSISSCGYIPAAHEVVLRGGSLWFFSAYLWSVIAWTVAVSIRMCCLDVIINLSPKLRYPSTDRRSARRTDGQLNCCTEPVLLLILSSWIREV
jgi:hypothetical protein